MVSDVEVEVEALACEEVCGVVADLLVGSEDGEFGEGFDCSSSVEGLEDE